MKKFTSELEAKLFEEFREETHRVRKHLPPNITLKQNSGEDYTIEVKDFKPITRTPKEEGWYVVFHFGNIANQIYYDITYWDETNKWHMPEKGILAYLKLDEDKKDCYVVDSLYADFLEIFGKEFMGKEFKTGIPEKEDYCLTIRKSGFGDFYTFVNRFKNGNWDINIADGSTTVAYTEWRIPALEKLDEIQSNK